MSTPRTILIIEDEDLLASILREQLTAAGHQVTVATTGQSGLETAKELHPDFIITDILLPELGGVEMISEMRKDEALQTTPIMVLSNLETIDGLTPELIDPKRDIVLKKTYYSLERLMETITTKLSEL